MPLIRGNYPPTNRDWLLAGSPTGTWRSSLRRLEARSDISTLSSGVMMSAAIYLEAGDVVTNLTFKSGATAAGTPTAWWFALYSNAATPALLAQTADQTSTAWAADTTKTLALSTAQSISATGIYYASIMVAASTPPSILGGSLGRAGVVLSAEKQPAQVSGSSLTTTAPSTIASPTATANMPLVIAT